MPVHELLRKLNDNETIASLATGIKRFTMPDEFNYIKLFRHVAASKGQCAKNALRALGVVYFDREQYERAADYFARAGEQEMVKHIRGNWGVFSPMPTQVVGHIDTVPYEFRNGKKVSFTVQVIDAKKLLDDVKADIRSNQKPKVTQKNSTNYSVPGEYTIVNVFHERHRYNQDEEVSTRSGYRLVYKQQRRYLGNTVAAWVQEITTTR